jgi:hypothetical protein
MMFKCGIGGYKPPTIPARIATWAEEISALIVIDAVNGPALASEVLNDLGPYQSR